MAGDKDTRDPAIRENLENVLHTRPFWLDLRITNAAGTTLMSQPSRREILPNALTDYLVSEIRERNSWAVVTDRTVDEARPIVIIAVPTQKGGAVIARIDGAAISQLFENIELSQQVVISVVDSDDRILYRRRGSEASLDAEVSWAPLTSVGTDVVEMISPIDGVKRTPLTTIKLLAHLLQKSGMTEEEKLDFAKTIAVECDRQIEFVGNLLDLSRIESGAYKLRQTRVDVRELISSCVNFERHRAESLGLRLTTNIPAGLPDVSGDFEPLRRVIRGLIDNAIKYTPEGGHIAISAREVDQALAISVSDTGKGIPENDLPHIFDKFYRVASESQSGVGLGLYLAQHIVAQLDGEITVESKPGVGTIFSVILPQWIAAAEEEGADVKALVSS